jgi:hypothetical protein
MATAAGGSAVAYFPLKIGGGIFIGVRGKILCGLRFIKHKPILEHIFLSVNYKMVRKPRFG